MKRWAAVLCILGTSLLSGCCCSCPGDCVPVSLEGCYDFVRFYGRCYHEFPYSCPCCPYYSGGGHHQVYQEYDLKSPGRAPKAASGQTGDLPAGTENEAAEDEVPPTPEPET